MFIRRIMLLPAVLLLLTGCAGLPDFWRDNRAAACLAFQVAVDEVVWAADDRAEMAATIVTAMDAADLILTDEDARIAVLGAAIRRHIPWDDLRPSQRRAVTYMLGRGGEIVHRHAEAGILSPDGVVELRDVTACVREAALTAA